MHLPITCSLENTHFKYSTIDMIRKVIKKLCHANIFLKCRNDNMYVKVDFGAEIIVLVGERLQRDDRIMLHISSKCLFAFL